MLPLGQETETRVFCLLVSSSSLHSYRHGVPFCTSPGPLSRLGMVYSLVEDNGGHMRRGKEQAFTQRHLHLTQQCGTDHVPM